jgi:hypothetical protein
MNKWKIEIILNSGKELTVCYKGYETNSTDVCKKVVCGGENTFNGFSNEDGTGNVLIKVGEISAMTIYAG